MSTIHPDLFTTVHTLEKHLATSALQTDPLSAVIERFGAIARQGDLSISRLMIGWRLLNPLYFVELLTWRADHDLVVERLSRHDAKYNQDFENTPIYAILNGEDDLMRCRLDRTNAPFEFPMFNDFARQGVTDYIITKVGFGRGYDMLKEEPGQGVVISFCSDRPGGFTDGEVAALERLRYMLALALRVTMEADMRATMAATYLGASTAKKVMGGEVFRGEGQSIDAVIWYCDLRGSTQLCEEMGVEAYIPLLNDYFSAMAEPVVAEGGEVLDFIGDAVLAIFPNKEGAIMRALRAARGALANLDGLRARHPVIATRTAPADLTGVAIDVGTVIYGNIGIPTRLAFSVIGPTVNKVTRVEGFTKELREPILVTEAVARERPSLWRSCGLFDLAGVSEGVELFALDAAIDDGNAVHRDRSGGHIGASRT
ncbi:MAG: adenylate/guanylate cyclase domain-containing protein [Pseudomonadota bacterium]